MPSGRACAVASAVGVAPCDGALADGAAGASVRPVNAGRVNREPNTTCGATDPGRRLIATADRALHHASPVDVRRVHRHRLWRLPGGEQDRLTEPAVAGGSTTVVVADTTVPGIAGKRSGIDAAVATVDGAARTLRSAVG